MLQKMSFFSLTHTEHMQQDSHVGFMNIDIYLAKPTPLLTPLASLSIRVEMT